jgi:hypothetical protein
VARKREDFKAEATVDVVSPLQFLASGIEIEPMESVTLVGLAASSDALNGPSSKTEDIRVEANGTKQLTLSTTSSHTSFLGLECIQSIRVLVL